MATQENRIAKRHYAERPLAKLTEGELAFLEELDVLRPLLRDPARARLAELAELADREGAERHFNSPEARRERGLEPIRPAANASRRNTGEPDAD